MTGKTDEWWNCWMRCAGRIARLGQPVRVFLSQNGYPTLIEGVGSTEAGVYTLAVSFGQFLEDCLEADRERRRRL